MVGVQEVQDLMDNKELGNTAMERTRHFQQYQPARALRL